MGMIMIGLGGTAREHVYSPLPLNPLLDLGSYFCISIGLVFGGDGDDDTKRQSLRLRSAGCCLLASRGFRTRTPAPARMPLLST